MSVIRVEISSKQNLGQEASSPQSIHFAQRTLTAEGENTYIGIPSLRGRVKKTAVKQAPISVEDQPTKTSPSSNLPLTPMQKQGMFLIPLSQGKIQLSDGTLYEGELLNGIPFGEGRLLYPNKTEYKGHVTNGQPHGFGTMQYPNGDTYTGEVANGIHHGQGTYTFADRTCYKGQLKNGCYDGLGTLNNANGNTYTGEFKNNKYHGQGKLTFTDGRPAKEGIFSNGKKMPKTDLQLPH